MKKETSTKTTRTKKTQATNNNAKQAKPKTKPIDKDAIIKELTEERDFLQSKIVEIANHVDEMISNVDKFNLIFSEGFSDILNYIDQFEKKGFLYKLFKGGKAVNEIKSKLYQLPQIVVNIDEDSEGDN